MRPKGALDDYQIPGLCTEDHELTRPPMDYVKRAEYVAEVKRRQRAETKVERLKRQLGNTKGRPVLVANPETLRRAEEVRNQLGITEHQWKTVTAKPLPKNLSRELFELRTRFCQEMRKPHGGRPGVTLPQIAASMGLRCHSGVHGWLSGKSGWFIMGRGKTEAKP